MIQHKTIYNIVMSLLICSISGAPYEITIINPAPFSPNEMVRTVSLEDGSRRCIIRPISGAPYEIILRNPAPLNPQEVAGTAVLEDGSRGCIMFASLSKDPTPVIQIVGLAGPLPEARIASITCFDINDDGDETTKDAKLKKRQNLQIHLPEQGYVSTITFVRETPPEYSNLPAIHATGMSAGGKFLAWIEIELYSTFGIAPMTKTEFNKTKAYFTALHREFTTHPEWVVETIDYRSGKLAQCVISSTIPILNLIAQEIKKPKRFIQFQLENIEELSQQEIKACQGFKETLGLSNLSIQEISYVIVEHDKAKLLRNRTPQLDALKQDEKDRLIRFVTEFEMRPKSLETRGIIQA